MTTEDAMRIAREDEFLREVFGDAEATPFVECLRARLAEGARSYGDASFSRAASDLLREMQQELVDVVGWMFVLFAGPLDPASASEAELSAKRAVVRERLARVARASRVQFAHIEAMRGVALDAEFIAGVRAALRASQAAITDGDRIAQIAEVAERYELEAEGVAWEGHEEW
ncbi:MAG: hypothetical protein IT379_16735 [Deltaproteobacteria bacterium]|nr:hypothetical protein [Deltaproteobacteria bacterium]